MVSLASLAFVLLRLFLVKEKKKRRLICFMHRQGWMKCCFPKHRSFSGPNPSKQKLLFLQVTPMEPILVLVPRWLRVPCCPFSLHLVLLLSFWYRNHHKQQALPCLYPVWLTAMGSSVGCYQGRPCSWNTSPHQEHDHPSHVSQMREGRSWFISKLAKLTLKWIIKF